MIRNTELLEQVMQHITDHPEKHSQEEWFCGTAACFAGWACLMSGWKQVEVDSVRVTRPGVSSYADTVATAELGLEEHEANRLFDGANTRDMLRLMVKDLVNGDKMRTIGQYMDEAGE